jgi:hypothetical protein
MGDPAQYSGANGISDDGSTIVGAFRSSGSQANQAYRWTADAGMVPLATENIVRSNALDASADGSIIVGNAQFSETTENEAFIWTAVDGMRPLQNMLVEDLGLADSVSGWTNLLAQAISADGFTIVGLGTNAAGLTEGFVANLRPRPGDFDGDGDVDDQDFLQWEVSFGVDGGGDADLDGDADGDDLLVWQRQFGAPSTAASAATPEPAALSLAALAAATFAARRRLA